MANIFSCRARLVARGIKADGAVVIGGQGGTVTPGLIDMHQHLMLNGGTAAGSYTWDAYVQGAHASRAAEYLLRSGLPPFGTSPATASA